MIPKASQRANGQDLATHLLNARDNEYVEVAQVRGAIASDLHGAFAEWEAQAHGLTRCRNYLYSLSLNPDPAQGRLTREQYLDFADRAEKRLGLEGQPRAVVVHIKNGREHMHVIWSRIDAREEKAIHQAFDREKLMMVARQFAREHGLALPMGMDPGVHEKRSRLSLYEKAQEAACGITKEERIRLITQLWRSSDGPKAFVRALEQHGYVLATGKRPYVLVDLYGNMNALPKLIDDKQVRTKDLRTFLAKDFPPESLPTVEEAKTLVAAHRKAREDFAKAQVRSDKADALKVVQAERRAKVEHDVASMRASHRTERRIIVERHLAERRSERAAYRQETRQVLIERERRKPTGLAAFLGRVSGVSFLLKKIQDRQDRLRETAHHLRLIDLRTSQRAVRLELQRRHEYMALDMDRKLRALDKVDKRERQSLETVQVREQRIRSRRGQGHIPALNLNLDPPGRKAVEHRAISRHTSPLMRPLSAQFESSRRGNQIDLTEQFRRSAGGSGDDGRSGNGSSGSKSPKAGRDRSRKQGRKRDDDFERER